MTEGFWPAGYVRDVGATGPRTPTGQRPMELMRILVEFLIGWPPRTGLTALPDQCTRTHIRVRAARDGQVHHVDCRWPGRVATACGSVLALPSVTFTAAPSSCARHGCVRLQQKAERPETVDGPSGAYQGGTAKTKCRGDATGNGVADRTDRDSFRSVKNAADNRARVGRISADQVATASPPGGGGNNSPVQARSRRPHGPSEGNRGLMESVATQALTPDASPGHIRMAQPATRRG